MTMTAQRIIITTTTSIRMKSNHHYLPYHLHPFMIHLIVTSLDPNHVNIVMHQVRINVMKRLVVDQNCFFKGRRNRSRMTRGDC